VSSLSSPGPLEDKGASAGHGGGKCTCPHAAGVGCSTQGLDRDWPVLEACRCELKLTSVRLIRMFPKKIWKQNGFSSVTLMLNDKIKYHHQARWLLQCGMGNKLRCGTPELPADVGQLQA
jgi:hypothetical protein